MIINEPNAKLRTLPATLRDEDGILVPLATSWSAGMVKISRNGSAFVDAVNLPVAVTAGGDGAFDFELAPSEVDAPGLVIVRFLDGDGELLAEYSDTISATLDPFIRQSEAEASARLVEVTLYDELGDLLDSETEWSAGMAKVSKAGGAFSNASALPVAVESGEDGRFTLQLTQGEVDTVGNVRVRFYTSGGEMIGEFVEQVRAVSNPTGEAAAVEAIHAHWKAGWESRHGVGPNFVPWLTANQINESTAEYVHMAVVPNQRNNTAFGAQGRFTSRGFIGVTIFVRKNIGVSRLFDLADDVRSVLEGRINLLGARRGVDVYAGESRSPMTVGAWMQLSVVCRYRWDEDRGSAE